MKRREPDVRPAEPPDSLFAPRAAQPPPPTVPPSAPAAAGDAEDDSDGDDDGMCPFARGSDTSFEAAVKKQDAASERGRVLAFIASRGELGATTDELEVALGGRHQAISPRVWELAGRDRKRPWLRAIRETALVRKTRSGRNAHVYVADPPGERQAS